MSNQNPPAGWYDQADGSRRYWDGGHWTQQVQPGNPTPYPGPPTYPGGPPQPPGWDPALYPGGPPPPPATKGLPAWGWILIILGAITLLCGGAGVILLGMGGKAVVDAVESAVASASAGVGQGFGSQDATGDVVLGTPVSDEASGLVTVPIIVTNASEKPSMYAIEVAAETPDGATQLGTTFAFVESVEPGQVAQSEAVFFTTFPAGTVFVVEQVSRLSTVG